MCEAPGQKLAGCEALRGVEVGRRAADIVDGAARHRPAIMHIAELGIGVRAESGEIGHRSPIFFGCPRLCRRTVQ